jgi:hypothetical protein
VKHEVNTTLPMAGAAFRSLLCPFFSSCFYFISGFSAPPAVAYKKFTQSKRELAGRKLTAKNKFFKLIISL